MKSIAAAISLALVGCSSHLLAEGGQQSIQIDKGTVFVSISDKPMVTPIRVTARPQGTCTPEVKIEQQGNLTKVTHIKECFGEGYHQGTYFDVLLAPGQDYLVSLKAGQVYAPDIRASSTIRAIRSSVNVGGIHGGGVGSQVKRKMLLGAELNLRNPASEQETLLVLHVNYGGIDFQ